MGRRILRNRRHAGLRVYPEDFDQVAARFQDIMDRSSWIALPGAVSDTVVPSDADYAPVVLTASNMLGYKTDTGNVIRSEKQKIANLVAVLEQRQIGTDEFTLTPGVSSGLLVVAIALKRMQIDEIIIELPGYFAMVEQCDLVGLNVALFPSSPSNGYRITAEDLSEFDRISDKPVALVVTQPRYGLGYNRDADEIRVLRNALRRGDVIIVDEAADQSVPSPFRDLDLADDVSVIRIRGLTKGLGLNSAKIAMILHPRSMRGILGEIVDYAGGSLDAGALQLGIALAGAPERYVALLKAAQLYVLQQHASLARASLGLPIRLAQIESGYLSTGHFPTIPGMSLDEFREHFLDAAVRVSLPVVRGSSLYFPYDGSGETIRINYFTSPTNMIRSGAAFHKLSTALYK